MGRGAYVPNRPPKPSKTAQVDTSTPEVPVTATKSTRTNSDWRRPNIRTPSFLSQNSSKAKLASPVAEQPPAQLLSHQNNKIADSQTMKSELPVVSVIELTCDETSDAVSSAQSDQLEPSVRPTIGRTSSDRASEDGEELNTYEADLDTLEDLTIEETHSSASSLYSADSSSIYSRDSASIYSWDSASIYSSASSIYSSGASIYSFDERRLKETDQFTRKGSSESILEEENVDGNLNSRLPDRFQHQQRARTGSVKARQRQEPQDAASRETSSLAKKAAHFKNSRLPPQLPFFSTSLPTWSMICRAAKASQECYDSHASYRRGIYTPANSSKDIKAMIVDDQLIDDTRLVIVAIRGTEVKSLADWTVNKDAKPAKPTGFLDDEENACHSGFLQVTKAMVAQVATQLQQHPASSVKPSLLFTGHSAGGAVAAMLYSHMLSVSVQSELTELASQFSSINCVTFGAPPLSLTPLQVRSNHGSGGVFLAFANEGDPILRLSDAAYVKSLAKLLTASNPIAAAAPKVKVVRRSRGTSIIREIVSAAPLPPWEELPLWPTPPVALTNAGNVILLRDDKKRGHAAASCVTSEELSDVIFGDFAQHPIGMYIRRVKDVAFAAMIGRNVE